MTSNPNPVHVLLADDDEDDLEFFRERLSDLSVATFLMTVGDGEKLLNALHTSDEIPPPHLIFLDINMPVMNGFECLTKIRSNKKFDRIPIFMFSTSTFYSDVEKAYQRGANLYIPKGLFFSEQKIVIEKLFSVYWEDWLAQIPREKFVLMKDHL